MVMGQVVVVVVEVDFQQQICKEQGFLLVDQVKKNKNNKKNARQWKRLEMQC
jgi:hypothetical protein